MKPLAERALDQVVLGNMNADEEWLVQNSPTSYSYWLNSLETRIESETNQDRSVKLRAQTVIATGISNARAAEQLCMALNRFAISWAFAYDYTESSIKALTSVNIYVHEVDEFYDGVLEPSTFQDAWLIIFVHSIWGQATLAGELAETIASISGGNAAHSAPATQKAPRQIPDVFCHLPDVLHQRPEWLRDYRPFTQWPPLGDWATVLKQSIEEEFDPRFSVSFTESPETAVVALSFEGEQISQWVLTRVEEQRYGVGMFSRQEFARLPFFTDSELANKTNLRMFEHPDFTQFGSWMANENSMFFSSMFPSAYLRTLEDSSAKHALLNYSPVFFARLALRGKSALQCINTTHGPPGADHGRVSEEFDLEALHGQVEEALKTHARRSVGLL